MIQLELTFSTKSNIEIFLYQKFPHISKTKLRKMYQQNRILHNEFVVKKNIDISPSDKVTILNKPHFINDLMVYYEDRDIVVVEKPPQLLSVDTVKCPGNSVHSILKRRYGLVFPVHRLDRETSGVMVFALSKNAKEQFDIQFQQRTVTRRYLAIAQGLMPGKKGVWDKPLKEGPDMKMYVDKNGKKAITYFFVKGHLKNKYTYIEFKLETGRKNQIRAHAQFFGYSLVGDSRYGLSKGSHLYLHAYKLSFMHPQRNKRMDFISAIPHSFQKMLL